MGFKGFIGLLFLLIFSLLSLQNLQLVSLVFFGSNPITFPLSIWILGFTGAGIFSGLIICLLNGSFTSNQAPQNKSQSYDNYYPRNPPNQPISQINLNQETRQSGRDKSQPSNDYDPDNNYSYTDYSHNREEKKANLSNRSQIQNIQGNSEEKEPLDYSQPKIGTNEILREDKTQIIPENTNQNIDEDQEESEINLAKILKPRQASLYSYQSRERTDIKSKSRSRSKSEAPSKPQPQSPTDIYDANYRVILPPSSSNNQRQDEDNPEMEEDWDF
jgi:hypothetical protein